MHYYKSREEVGRAAQKRVDEARAVREEAKRALDPIMQSYNISKPEDIAERLVKAIDERKLEQTKENMDRVVQVAETLITYFNAETDAEEFAFVAKHIDSTGDHRSESNLIGLPREHQVIKMSTEEVMRFFEPYTTSPARDGYGLKVYGRKVVNQNHHHATLSRLMYWGNAEPAGMGFSQALQGLQGVAAARGASPETF